MWNLSISSGLSASTLLSALFSPHTSWFVPHRAMRSVHVTHPSVVERPCGCFLSTLCLSTCHANTFLCSPDPHGFLLSRVLPHACLGNSDLPAVSRGPSPLPEPAAAGDIMTGEFSLLYLCCISSVQPAWTSRDSCFAWSWWLHAHAHARQSCASKRRTLPVGTQLGFRDAFVLLLRLLCTSLSLQEQAEYRERAVRFSLYGELWCCSAVAVGLF